MKSFTFIIGLFLMSITVFNLSNCNTTKPSNSQTTDMIILLKEGKTDKYIIKNYASYNPTNVKKISRSQNQYQATFTYSNKNEIQEALNNDSNVIEANFVNNNGIDIQSGSNQKKTKATPGGNK